MKSLLMTGIFSLVSVSAFAADVKVTSFHFIERPPINGPVENNSAEICGTVSGADKVLITVDPGKNQGEYVTLASPKGNFCLIVNTFTGRANAEAISAANAVVASTSTSISK